jgi:hypothetical protein
MESDHLLSLAARALNISNALSHRARNAQTEAERNACLARIANVSARALDLISTYRTTLSALDDSID